MKNKKQVLLSLLILFSTSLYADDYNISVKRQVLATTTLDIQLNEILEIPGECINQLPVLTNPDPTKGSLSVRRGEVSYQSNVSLDDYFGSDKFGFTINCGSDNYYVTVDLEIIPKPDNIEESICYVEPNATVWSIKEETVIDENSVSVCNYAPLLVGDLDGDGIVEIVAESSCNGKDPFPSNTVKIFNYINNKLILKNTFTYKNSSGDAVSLAALASSKAICRYNNSGYIVIASTDKYLYAYDENGNYRWRSSTSYERVTTFVNIADFNGDGIPEIYMGNKIYSLLDGKELCNGGSNNTGAFVYLSFPLDASMAVDIDGDGFLELVAGTQIYRITETSGVWSMNVMPEWSLDLSLLSHLPQGTYDLYNGDRVDGATIVADIDNDGGLEVVVMSRVSRNLTVIVWRPLPGGDSKLIGTFQAAVGFASSIPMIGPVINNDSKEIVFITSVPNIMYCLKYNPERGDGDKIDLHWTLSHTDGSGATGMTLFDFNQDGQSEIVYRDETLLRIINGSGLYLNNGIYESSINSNGTLNANKAVLASFDNVLSNTLHEFPVIADVSGDGQADIIVTGHISGSVPASGYVRIFKSDVSAGAAPWAPARPVWNQYFYNAVNVNEDLTIPKNQLNPTTLFSGKDETLGTADDVRPYNAFMQQQTMINQYGIPFVPAPDIYIKSDLNYTMDEDRNMIITFNIQNQGSVTMETPVSVALYKESIGVANLLDVFTISEVIPLGQTKSVSLTVPAGLLSSTGQLVINLNDDGTAEYIQPECDIDNNRLTLSLFNDFYGHGYTDTPTTNYFHILENDLRFSDASSLAISNLSSSAGSTLNVATGYFSGIDGLEYTPPLGFKGLDIISYTASGVDSESNPVVMQGIVSVYVFEGNGHFCPEETSTYIAFTDDDYDIQVNWFYPVTGTSADNLSIPNPLTETVELRAAVFFNASSSPLAAFNNRVTAYCRMKEIPDLMYWKADAQNHNWNDPDNWASDELGTSINNVPASCTTVHIPGNATNYPELDIVNTIRTEKYGDPECDKIIFHFGGEVARTDLLSYNKAFIQYNVGYYDASNTYKTDGDPISATPMTRNRWYALSTPLKKIATGDFSFGGKPNTWQMSFVRSTLGSDWIGEFTDPFNTNSIELNEEYAYSYVFWADAYAAGVWGEQDQDGLNAVKGVIELPYFENTVASNYHRIHSYDRLSQTSSFKYYYYDDPALPIAEWKTPGTIYRGKNNEAYRFIFDEKIEQNAEGKNVFKITVPTGKEIMIGNPVMSNIDFKAFYETNQDKISGYYRLYDNVFHTYSYENGAANILPDYIAPLQGFFIETLASASENVQLEFPFELVSAVTKPELKLRTDAGLDELLNSLSIQAVSEGNSSSAILSVSDGTKNNVRRLFYDYATSIPQLYLVDENGMKNDIQQIGISGANIPLGIRMEDRGEITLKFEFADRFNVESLTLVDTKTGTETNLLKTNSYTFAHDTDGDRFVLRVGRLRNVTGIDDLETEASLSVYPQGNRIVVSSNQPIAAIEVYDTQGRLIIQQTTTDGLFINDSGIYIVRVTLANGERKAVKVTM